MTWILVSGGSLAILGLASAAGFIVASDTGVLSLVLRSHAKRLERHAAFLILPYSGRVLANVHVVTVSVALVLVLATRSLVFLIVVAIVTVGPLMLLSKFHALRVVKLERQLDGWLLLLANALKATSSVGDAIASTASLAPQPFSEEVDLLVKELRLGMPLDRALAACSRRIGSSVVSGALMIVVVARHTGGDLATTLERVSAALRETARLEGLLRTKTAEGRGQVLVLALVPFLLSALIVWLDRSWFDPMLHHAYGRAVLSACATMWILAALWAHQIAGTRL